MQVWLGMALAVVSTCQAAGQNAEAVSQFFEGKQVMVKLDMPGSQKGVEIYPAKAQPLDTKSYSSRLKDFGVSLRNGDTVVVTKVKVKSDNIVEFQLGGGGYGTALDNTDTSVHFTPADKSSHEKELEDQLKTETDEDRRRSLSRELDDLRRDRERQDHRNQARAQDDADSRKQQIYESRQQGGSRFNIHFDKKTGDALTPEAIMGALAAYVAFSPEPLAPNSSALRSGARMSDAGAPPPPQPVNRRWIQEFEKGFDAGPG
ncbi:MAG: hypothetical protein M3Y24_03670 [Acidobacteriota bacterium]|nr:hypothetical protein [Acidobacteriota bacterium]